MSSSAQGPTAFSNYASKFLTGSRASVKELPSSSRIFRSSSPGSPSHDPFLPSPTASRSYPRLPGSSNTSLSASPNRTPPFPGPGVDGIPSIADVDDLNLHDMESNPGSRSHTASADDNSQLRRVQRGDVPDPYGPSSDSEGELETDLDHVAQVRRSLIQPQHNPQQRNSRAAKGWMAYQSVFPSSSSSSDASESDKETEDGSEPDQMGIMGQSRPRMWNGDQSDVPQLVSSSINLEEPLLRPDDLAEMATRIPVRLQVYQGRFAHWDRGGLRRYKDPGFLALWIITLIALVMGLMFVWGSTDPPKSSPRLSPPSLVPLLPFLLLLLVPTLALPPVFLFLLSKTVRPVLVATAVCIPFSLFICGWWALGASFESLSNSEGGWWATTGMRIGAAILWLLSAAFARMIWVRRQRLERTVGVVELSTQLLLSHPPLLVLTPLLMAVFAVMSIPFLAMLLRLAKIGYWRHPRENTYIYYIRPYAGWLIVLVVVAWVWSWGVIRGIGRVSVAALVGEWYFHREDRLDPLEVTTAAVHRATGPSLGSVCLGSLIVASVRIAGRVAAELKRITSPRSKILPSALSFLSVLTPFFTMVASVLDQLNGYALVYVGITGEAFWPSARRAVGLTSRRNGERLLDYTLIKLLLTLNSTVAALFTATAGYLYMAHSLGNPNYAPVAGLLCGGVPFLAIQSGVAIMNDAADALFICLQIDNEAGGSHCTEAKEAFTGEIFRADGVV